MRSMKAASLLFTLLLVCSGWAHAAPASRPSMPTPAVQVEVRGSASVLGELTPSRRLASGEAVEALGFERKSELTLTVMSALPIEAVAEVVGLRRLQWAYRSGGYEQSVTPNLVVDVAAAAKAQLADFALAWMYVYQQDSVPFFEASGAGRPGVRITFAKELTVEREQAMFAELARALGPTAGYTRFSDREILVIDFEGAGFAAQLERFAGLMAASNAIVASEAFAVQCAFPTHDWAADPDGATLIARLHLSREAEARLREMRGRYERLVEGWLEPVVAVHEHAAAP
jgi:hypothetical protein